MLALLLGGCGGGGGKDAPQIDLVSGQNGGSTSQGSDAGGQDGGGGSPSPMESALLNGDSRGLQATTLLDAALQEIARLAQF